MRGTKSCEAAYGVLELPVGAGPSEVRRAYRRLVRRYHPDTGGAGADPARLNDVLRAFAALRARRGSNRVRSAAVRAYHASGPDRSGPYEARAVLDVLA